MKTTFLQAVSHDLRTPLAAILGLAVTMERDDIDITEDENRDMARRIASNARKLDRIVTDFLDLDRLNRGLAEPHFEPIDVGGADPRDRRELRPGRRAAPGHRRRADHGQGGRGDGRTDRREPARQHA